MIHCEIQVLFFSRKLYLYVCMYESFDLLIMNVTNPWISDIHSKVTHSKSHNLSFLLSLYLKLVVLRKSLRLYLAARTPTPNAFIDNEAASCGLRKPLSD